MARKGRTVKYTDRELLKLTAEEATLSDWDKAAGLTSDEIEAQVASDPDEEEMIVDWAAATIAPPQTKAVLNMRIDQEILDYFRKTGKGYQSRINAVLRSYVEQKVHRQNQRPKGQ